MHEEFKLGLIPTPPARRKLFAPSPFKPLPQSEWRDVDRRQFFHDLKWYPDQRQCNGCVGFSSAMAISKARVITGQPPVKLSGAYLYSLINGGRDQGAMIADGLDAAREYGCATEASCPIAGTYDYIKRQNTKQFDAEAARFKAFGAPIDTAEEAVAAILAGAVLEYGVCVVPGKFGQLDAEGARYFQPGGANHAVHADGLKKLPSGRWALDSQTWTPNFADRSRWYEPLDFIDKTGYQEMWAVWAAIDDPADVFTPPDPK